MFTDDFKRLLVDFVHDVTFMSLKSAFKAWKVLAEEVIDDGVATGAMLAHDGNNVLRPFTSARDKRFKLVTRVFFLQNLPRVGNNACYRAANLLVVDIPKGVESISTDAFGHCTRLTTVSFPSTLKSIGSFAFYICFPLDNVDLLHTNLQELGEEAFRHCGELKSMTILDSLQTIGVNVSTHCYKLVPSDINIRGGVWNDDTTPEVIAHLCSQQLLSANPPAQHTDDFMRTPEFKRHFVEFVPDDTLMALRSTTKAWKAVVEEVIDERVECDVGSRWEGYKLSSLDPKP